MGGLLVGMVIGYIAFTEQGHKIGNAAANMIIEKGKNVIETQRKKSGSKNENAMEVIENEDYQETGEDD